MPPRVPLPSTAHLPPQQTQASQQSQAQSQQQQQQAAQNGQAAAQQAAAAAQQDALSVILVTGGYDNTIRFWEAWSGVCSRTVNHPDHQVNRLAISPDKRYLAAAGNGTIKLYDIAASAAGTSGANVGPLATFTGHTANVTSLAWNAEAKWLCSGSEDGTVRIWDVRTGSAQRNYKHSAPVNDLALHSNQGELISCDQAGAIKIWDLSQDMCSHELLPEEDVAVRSVSIASDGSTLVAGNQHGVVYVWSIQPGLQFTDLQPKTKFQAHGKYLVKVLVSPDTKNLATCSADTTIKIWSSNSATAAATGKGSVNDTGYTLEKVLTGHQRWVWDMAYSADSAYLVSASSDHTARLWELASGSTVRQYNAHHKACVCVALNDSSS